jgi:hypothetical protein
MATLSYLKRNINDAMTAAISSNGETLAQQITDEACKKIAEKIPEMVSNITNGVITKLNDKVDSDEFSKKFVNVLQQKLLEEKTISEPFLSKFSELFDKIVEKALDDYKKQPLSSSAGSETEPASTVSPEISPLTEQTPAPEISPLTEQTPAPEISPLTEQTPVNEIKGGRRNRQTRKPFAKNRSRKLKQKKLTRLPK